jgi:hypothetical protein
VLARSEAESAIAAIKQARLILDWTATMNPRRNELKTTWSIWQCYNEIGYVSTRWVKCE